MIDAISGIQGSYSVKKVTGYSEKEKQKLLRNFENFSKEREELHEYLSQFPKPGNHSFGELIEMAKNKDFDNYESDDYILDIKSK